MNEQRQPVWALMGPTAIGKSALALAAAERVGGEIISCDSVQVYRGFDCGSAKPSAAERQRVPHHLLDVAEAAVPYDAMQWARAAQLAIADIRSRGRVPIICGGTGLYLRALRDGLLAAPADAALRAQWQAREQQQPGSVFAALTELDGDSAAQIGPYNPAHLLRALEISLLLGQPASAVRRAHRQASNAGQPVSLVALTAPRPWLRARMAARIEGMLAMGLVAETAALLEAGVPPTCAPMRAVGYCEARAVLAGSLAPAALPEVLLTRTWQYARRQLTWLRREPAHLSLAADQPQLLEALLAGWRAGDAAPPTASAG